MFDFYTLHQTLRKKEWSYDTEYYELVVSTVWYRTMVGTYGTYGTVLVGTVVKVTIAVSGGGDAERPGSWLLDDLHQGPSIDDSLSL